MKPGFFEAGVFDNQLDNVVQNHSRKTPLARLNSRRKLDGETGIRTRDTTIFSRVLYQLSYLAAGRPSDATDSPPCGHREWHPHTDVAIVRIGPTPPGTEGGSPYPRSNSSTSAS